MRLKVILFFLKREQIRLSKKVPTTKDKVALLDKAKKLQNIVAKVKELQ